MTERINEYAPPADVVALKPTAMDFFYAKPHGVELIGLTLRTPDLGDFAVLFTVEAARQVATSLTNMAKVDLDELRRKHAERFGQP
jgi:hypothetical protein